MSEKDASGIPLRYQHLYLLEKPILKQPALLLEKQCASIATASTLVLPEMFTTRVSTMLRRKHISLSRRRGENTVAWMQAYSQHHKKLAHYGVACPFFTEKMSGIRICNYAIYLFACTKMLKLCLWDKRHTLSHLAA